MRRYIKELLHELSLQEVLEKNRAIHKQLFATKQWKQATVIGITISKGREVDTYRIIQQAWGENKIVVVPRCKKEDYSMVFRVLKSFEQLEDTFFGLREPIISQTVEWKKEIELLFVPGVAFTISGERLGYGGGYYDRYLSSYKGDSIALCYEVQIINNVITEPHDQRVHMLVSEKNIYVNNE